MYYRRFFSIVLMLLAFVGCQLGQGEAKEIEESIYLGRALDFANGIPNQGVSSNNTPIIELFDIGYVGKLEFFSGSNCEGKLLGSLNISENSDAEDRKLRLSSPLIGDKIYTFTAKFFFLNKVRCSPPISYTLDTVAPTITVTSAGGSTSVHYILEGKCEAGLSVRIFGAGLADSSSQYTDCDEEKNAGTFRASVYLSTSNGVKPLQIQQTDLAGNVASMTHQVALRVDEIAPPLTITSPGYTRSTDYTLTGDCEAGLGVSISGTGLSGGNSVGHCVDKDTNTTNNGNQSSGRFSVELTLKAEAGSKQIKIKQVDDYKNETLITFSVYLNTNVSSPILAFANNDPVDGGHSKNNNPSFIANYLPQVGGTAKLYSGNSCSGSTVGTSTFTPTQRKITIALGAPLSGDQVYTYSAKVTDTTNNDSICSNGVSFTLDQTSPIMTIAALPTLTKENRGAYAVNGNCTFSDSQVSVSVEDRGTELTDTKKAPCSNNGGSGRWSVQFNLVDVNLEAAQRVTISVAQTDGAGNTAKTESPALTIPDCVSNNFFKGDGTSAHPYQVCSAYHLQKISEDLDASYTLAQDVDASITQTEVSDPLGVFGANGFTPIGGRSLGENKYAAFSGTLDGSNHAILGLFINSGAKHVGLFGRIKGSAQIKNVRLENVNIQTRGESSGPLIGVIDGSSPGASGSPLIQNNRVTGSLELGSLHTWNHTQAGGIIGDIINSARIINNNASTALSVETRMVFSLHWRIRLGGLIGRVSLNKSGSELVIKGSSSKSSIAYLPSSSKPHRIYVGGLVGRTNMGTGSTLGINKSYATGPLSSWSDCESVCTFGGLIGLFYPRGTGVNFKMTDNYSLSDMLGSSFSMYGGLIGFYYSSATGIFKILRNYRAGVISVGKASTSPRSSLGGLFADIEGVINAGGIEIRHNFATGIINDLYSTHEVKAGGLARQILNGGTFDRNYANLDINIKSSHSSADIAGLFFRSTQVAPQRSFFNLDSLLLNGTSTSGKKGEVTNCFGGDSSSNLKSLSAQSSGSCNGIDSITYYKWHTATDLDGDNNVDQRSVRYDSDGDNDIDANDALTWDFGTSSDFPQLSSHNSNEQAVHIASALLRFSLTVTGEMVPHKHLFYDIDNSATSIDITGHGAQGTTVVYTIIDAKSGTGATLTAPLPSVSNNSIDISNLNSNDEFTLRATFSKNLGNVVKSFTKNYQFRK